jgi:uncharacterized protein YggE
VDSTIVTVHGEARREVPPELAVFSVTVSAKDRDKPSVVARLTKRAAEVGEILDRHGPAVERRETAGLHIYQEYRRRGERSAMHSGSLTTTVTVSDFDPLGELLAQLASGDSIQVSGPWWRLRPGSRAGADVRREAVIDALDRAREYAAAVGSELDRIVEISDADAAGGGYSMAMRVGAAGSAAEEDDSPSFELDPRQQTVEARVLLRVTITEPTVLRA